MGEPISTDELVDYAADRVAERWGWASSRVARLSHDDKVKMLGVSLYLGSLFDDNAAAERDWIRESGMEAISDIVAKAEKACGLK